MSNISTRTTTISGRLMRPLVAASVLIAALVMPVMSTATEAGGCLLSGSASFSPSILYAPQFGSTVTMSGTLSSCTQAPSTGPASGTLSMGNVITDSVTGYQWQEPVGVLQGGCLAAITRGSPIIRWVDGTITVITITVDSVFSQLVVTGAVSPSITLTAVNQQDGQPSSITITTDRFAVGSAVTGYLSVIGPETAALTCAEGATPTVSFLGGSTLADD